MATCKLLRPVQPLTNEEYNVLVQFILFIHIKVARHSTLWLHLMNLLFTDLLRHLNPMQCVMVTGCDYLHQSLVLPCYNQHATSPRTHPGQYCSTPWRSEFPPVHPQRSTNTGLGSYELLTQCNRVVIVVLVEHISMSWETVKVGEHSMWQRAYLANIRLHVVAVPCVWVAQHVKLYTVLWARFILYTILYTLQCNSDLPRYQSQTEATHHESHQTFGFYRHDAAAHCAQL